ncbi:MAG: ABC transporter substrate-binding protein [Anaerolineaceae bacterium]|nr:ABC transporter substrate-binding protein [Anaerolineaceae bacterium]
MNNRSMLIKLMSVILLFALLLAACSPAATPTAAPVANDTPQAQATSVPQDESPSEPTAEEAPTMEAAEPVTLSLLGAQNQNDALMINALTDAYTALHPNVTFDIEVSAAGGTEIDNLVKTRLATGEMNDIFYYNSGSLLQALHPSETLVDLSQEPFMENIVASFIPTVSQNGGTFGVPVGYASAGGVLYNKKVYEQVGLSVPTTWEEFQSNNEALKAAGIPPVLQTYGDTWTAQLFVLADNYNVAQAVPAFADDYTANKAKYADIPAAMAGFEHLQEGYEKDWYQPDSATTKFEQGLEMLANGDVAQYPMLTQVVPTIAANWPDKVNDIGFFALPGPDASKNGATIWMPLAFYIPKTTEHVDVAKDFLAFVASTAGTDAISAQVTPAGPYLIQGATLPDDVFSFVNDLTGYIDSGNSYPALEFLSPIKGPNLEQICVAVGTGQMDAATAAANYDEDVKKQAQQLGIPGW